MHAKGSMAVRWSLMVREPGPAGRAGSFQPWKEVTDEMAGQLRRPVPAFYLPVRACQVFDWSSQNISVAEQRSYCV